MRRTPSLGAVAVAVVLVCAGCLGTPGGAGTPTDPERADRTPTRESTPRSDVRANGTLEVHFINVGQSVSTLVVGPTNETMLVDSGDFTDDGEYVLQYLRRHDIDRIDHLVVSHNDADHIGGNAAVIEYYETRADGIGAVYDPGIAASTRTYEEYLDAVETHGVTLYEVREGDPLDFEGVAVRVLGPPEPYIANGARNENSVVLRLSHGNTSFLLPGDAEDDQEQYLLDTYGGQLRATVLKAGHHGSKSSSGGPFLDAVRPTAVAISSAYDSRYGHPHEETLRRLASRSIPTYWTATHGNIVFVSDGERVAVETQRAAPTAPLSLRAGDPVAPGTTGTVAVRAAFDGAGGGSDPVTLSIAAIHADAAGDDRDNLGDEYVVFGNPGTESITLTGWTVRDEAGHTYTFPEFTLAPNATVTLHTGVGTDTETALYWGRESPVWNNDGDTVVVTNADGEPVRSEGYP